MFTSNVRVCLVGKLHGKVSIHFCWHYSCFIYTISFQSLVWTTVGTHEISLKLIPLISKFQENNFFVVWEIRPDRCDLLIYQCLICGSLCYFCVMLHQVIQGHPKYPPPIIGPNDQIFVQFSLVQFIQFHQIHYKSKRPTGYRTSHSAIYMYRYLC